MKRLFVLCVSCGFFVLEQARRLCFLAMGRRVPGTCVVLQYHAVPDGHRESFAQQLDLAQHLATLVRADSQDPLPASQKHVAITFDDGLTSFVENALPELEKRNICAALFVIAGKLGTLPAWNKYFNNTTWASASTETPAERMITEEELRKLSGRVLIGSHSSTHRMLTELDQADARHEIEDSRRRLESIIGQRVTLFSFPYGAFTEDLLVFCKNAGYERVFTVLPVLAFREPQEFVSGRVNVDPTDWSLEFRLKIAGCYRWLPYASDLKRALSRALTFHLREAKKVGLA
jgi:peptidoglycan/xylan/chitin deacetylase (PgdA/CDA1 family)